MVEVNGQEGAEYDGIAEHYRSLSPDGKRVVYRAQKGEKKLVVVDGQEGPEYHWIGTLSFSPGDVLEYPAVKENSFYRIRYGPSLR